MLGSTLQLCTAQVSWFWNRTCAALDALRPPAGLVVSLRGWASPSSLCVPRGAEEEQRAVAVPVCRIMWERSPARAPPKGSNAAAISVRPIAASLTATL